MAAQLKPLDYQQRLSQELKQSLQDAGVLQTEDPRPQQRPPLDEIDELPDVPRDPLPRPTSHTTMNGLEEFDGKLSIDLVKLINDEGGMLTTREGLARRCLNSVYVEDGVLFSLLLFLSFLII